MTDFLEAIRVPRTSASRTAALKTDFSNRTTRIYVFCSALAAQVENANDEAPQFERPEYRFSVVEHAAAETPVGTVRARDNDDPAGKTQLRYSIEPTEGTGKWHSRYDSHASRVNFFLVDYQILHYIF